MTRFSFTLFLLLTCSFAFATVSPDSAKLERLRLQVEKTHDSSSEEQYLKAFPSDYKNFVHVFYGKDLKALDELYDKYDEHLSLLQSLSEKHAVRVLSIWLGVATNGHWEADAVGMLQHQLAKYASSNTRVFADALLTKAPSDRSSIIRFMADVENHHSYHDYSAIIENLSSLGYTELSQQFAAAKQDRMKQKHR